MNSGNLIAEKSMNFAVRIVNFYKYLISEKHEYVMSKQILRCGTSIGANVKESENAQSKADFISKMNIALKEASESEYWLELLYRTEYLSERQYNDLNEDCTELIRILTAIVKSSKR